MRGRARAGNEAIIDLTRLPLWTSLASFSGSMPNWSMESAIRWIRTSSTGPVGNPGSAMTEVTDRGSASDFAMAASATAGSTSAICWPCSMARTNAAAVAGCSFAQAWVTTYPSMGKFMVAP